MENVVRPGSSLLVALLAASCAGAGPGPPKPLLAQASAGMPVPGPALLLEDPLTSAAPVAGAKSKRSTEGVFGATGWRATGPSGMLVVELERATALEGALEVDVAGLDWAVHNAAAGKDTKIHFINMFSNPNGDHHVEDGGTADDALWTLRAGADDEGWPRYGSSFKVLWASRGAKRASGSDYHEVARAAPPGWSWDPAARYTFRVTWSRARGTWDVAVNGRAFYEQPWKHQVRPLRYVFLGRARDFRSLQGPSFSNLRVYASAAPSKPPAPSTGALALSALEHFPAISVPGFVPYYKNRGRGALAIDASRHKDARAAARATFAGPAGRYDLTLVTLTERDGESSYRVKVNGRLIGQTQNPVAPDDQEVARTWPGVALHPGDVLQIESDSVSNRKEPEGDGFAYARGRWRRVLLAPRF